ncbi:MAG: hypothetical protein R3266_15840, partial [Gemmatimonadota bacterium]|nr:hypothetical protein [Gemmatimonadota bacterium]
SQAQGNSFVLPDTWINGNGFSNNEFAEVMRSYKARCRANEARSDAEANSSTDWSQVAADAAAGRELVILGEDSSSDTPWWDGIKSLGTENATWHRMHMDWIGMADQSGEYQDWLTFPIPQRTARQITTPDLRYPAQNVDGEEGLYHRYNATIIFRPERGTYRQSHYGDLRHDAYLNSCSFCYFGPINEIIQAELDLYRAEAAFRTGDMGTTVSILNQTRVGNGGLTPLVDGGTVPTEPDGSCVPRKRYDVQGRCGDLRDALIYEHFEEIFHESGGLEFWHGRRFDILPLNTALHMPIPAADLEVLQESIYTFGGGGAGSAGDPTPLVVPGNLDSALERVTYSLGRIEQRRENLQRLKTSGLVTR